jgi:hypothetical protein
MNIKDELLKVYCNRISDFQHIQDACKGEQIAGALLMSPSENYAKQPFPFLAIGQETRGWETFSDVVTKEECVEMMSEHENFTVREKKSASPFWNVIRKIETALGNEPCSCAWTNISKYDQDGGKPDVEHEKLFSTVDNLLIDEIKITKPKICLFFTNHNFDSRLKNIFEQIKFVEVDGFNINDLCQLKHPDLPILTFRTDHPKSLRIRKIEESVIDFISEQIKK